MNNKDVEKALRQAVIGYMPDVLDRVMSANVEDDDMIKEFRDIQSAGKSEVTKKLRLASCLMALLLCVIAGGKFLLTPKVDYIVSIDVNPSIEMSVDRKDMVIECRALNTDAEMILDGMDLKRINVKVATNAILGSMVKNGYFNPGDINNAILISVVDAEPEKAEQVKNELSGAVRDVLREQNSAVTLMYQSDNASANMREFAENNHISIGKADFVLKLSSKDASLVPEELALMSVKELSEIVKRRGINIYDIVTEYDDDIDDAIEDTIEDVNKMNGYDDDIDDKYDDDKYYYDKHKDDDDDYDKDYDDDDDKDDDDKDHDDDYKDGDNKDYDDDDKDDDDKNRDDDDKDDDDKDRDDDDKDDDDKDRDDDDKDDDDKDHDDDDKDDDDKDHDDDEDKDDDDD